MRRRPPWHHEWDSVDLASDPAFFVRFLDVSRASLQAAVQADPRQFFGYLDLQQGQWVLDAGCGTGDLTRPLAHLVGSAGRVVGLDRSETMIAEARHRGHGSGLPIEFCAGDVHHLDFDDATFDHCLASALFQHLEDPHSALAELVRVARPGGRVAVMDHDWGTFAIDADDRAVTRKILDFFCDTVREGWMGRRLPGLFKEFGLVDLTVTGSSLPLTDYQMLEEWLLRRTVEDAEAAGVVSADEAASWFGDLRRRARYGRFFSAVTVFRVSGRKP